MADPMGSVEKIVKVALMIKEAVDKVRNNKEECCEIRKRVDRVSALLTRLQETEMMKDPATGGALKELEETLTVALELITACQQENVLTQFFTAGKLAKQLRKVKQDISDLMADGNFAVNVNTTVILKRFQLATSSPPQKASEGADTLAGHANPDFRIEGSAADYSGIEPGAGAVTEPSPMEEQQPIAYENAEVLPNRRNRFRRLLQWAQRRTSTPEYISGLLGHENTGGFTVFKFSQLAACTNNFSSNMLIGVGGHAKVYKGVLPNSQCAAIKTCCINDSTNRDEFKNEVQIISGLQHANIVKLLGCCFDENHTILVYEYVPGGTLHHIIDELQAGVLLAWPLRFQIIEGIAQGIVYLHQHSRQRVVHLDIKPTNILLDDDMAPVITDFGISVVLHSDKDGFPDMVKGTLGYIDPEYYHTGLISTKCDVYCFGVTFLSVITAQHAYTRGFDLYSHTWELWSSGRVMEVIDPSLRDDPRISEILRCLQIAMLCIQETQADRPTMAEVLMMLKCESMTLPVPRHHGAPADTTREGECESSADGSETPGNASYIGAELTAEEDDDESSLYLSCCSDDGVDNGHASS